MRSFHDTWRVRRPFGDIEIELHPASVDTAACEASLRELRQLVNDFKYRQPEARRVVLEVYDRMRGLPASMSRGETYGLDTGSLRADAIGEELLFAAHAGRLVARRREERTVVIPLDTPSNAVLGPTSATTHVYTVYVADDTGAPVAGAKLTVDIAGDKQDKTTDGSGKVTVEKTVSDSGIVTLTNREELLDKLWPQWAKPLTDKPFPGDKITQALVTQPIAPFPAPADWLVTLVIQRPPIWRVRMVGMLFDADKCFLIPQALDGIRSIVAMHQAHPDAKVVIVGHEGGDEEGGSVDLALGRAKILAAFLTNKPDDWMPWFDSDKSSRQRWGVREVQLMLSALPGADGKPYYDGSGPGVMDDKTTSALEAFQLAGRRQAGGRDAQGARDEVHGPGGHVARGGRATRGARVHGAPGRHADGRRATARRPAPRGAVLRHRPQAGAFRGHVVGGIARVPCVEDADGADRGLREPRHSRAARRSAEAAGGSRHRAPRRAYAAGHDGGRSRVRDVLGHGGR